jgi:hypothetical protein
MAEEPKKGDPTTYVVERQVTPEDLGVPAPAPSGGAAGASAAGNGHAAVRTALGKLGPAWVYVGEADGTNKDKVLTAVLDGLGEKAKDGVYRVNAKRYLGEPQPIKKKVHHSWEVG